MLGKHQPVFIDYVRRPALHEGIKGSEKFDVGYVSKSFDWFRPSDGGYVITRRKMVWVSSEEARFNGLNVSLSQFLLNVRGEKDALGILSTCFVCPVVGLDKSRKLRIRLFFGKATQELRRKDFET